jgi:hypothetical protein
MGNAQAKQPVISQVKFSSFNIGVLSFGKVLAASVNVLAAVACAGSGCSAALVFYFAQALFHKCKPGSRVSKSVIPGWSPAGMSKGLHALLRLFLASSHAWRCSRICAVFFKVLFCLFVWLGSQGLGRKGGVCRLWPLAFARCRSSSTSCGWRGVARKSGVGGWPVVRIVSWTRQSCDLLE